MENTIMEDKNQDQSFSFQGKNQKASEGWFDLITQIALDYRRITNSNESLEQKYNETITAELEANSDALAV